MEFKFSDKTSSMMNEKLCDDHNFVSAQWITEGSECPCAMVPPLANLIYARSLRARTDQLMCVLLSLGAEEKIVSQSTPCPIMGDYTVEVPGASGLCAKVASDCNNPDIMFYILNF